MQFDELAQHLTEMALAGVHRATRDFGLSGKSKYAGDKEEQQGIAIMRNERLEKKLEAEIDPHNVLPPLHIVLHDIPHPMRQIPVGEQVPPEYKGQFLKGTLNRDVARRAKQLSTPDSIVLIASPTVGKGGEIVGPFAIIHNWAHMMPKRVAFDVLKTMIRAAVDLISPDNPHYEDLKNEITEVGWDSKYATPNSIIAPWYDRSVLMKYFAIPSGDVGELVYNMFYQYVKFGKITFHFASKEQLLPYTQRVVQIFNNWVNSQKGKVVSTRILKQKEKDSHKYLSVE